MKNFSLFVFLLLIFSFQSVSADVYDKPESAENIAKQIPYMESIKCKFRQEKQIKNLQKPLVSSGDFEFVKNKGVFFYTKFPVESATNYTNENCKQINDVINAISSKKYSKLEREFNFYFEKNGDNWTLGLKPKDTSNASKIISHIAIEGNIQISKIEILQTNGNKTVLWFTK